MNTQGVQVNERGLAWRRVKLGEIVERHVERVDKVDGYSRFVGVDHLDSGDLRLRRYGAIGSDELPPTFRFVFHPGMILVPTRRPRLRKCAVAPFNGLTGEKVLVLRPRADAGDVAELLPYLISSPQVQDWNIQMEVGSVTPHFRWADMAEGEVWLPPKNEQPRILAALVRARELVEATMALRSAVTDVFRAWLHQVGDSLLKDSATQVSLADLLDGAPESGCSAPERDSPTGCWVLGLSALSEAGYVAHQLKAVEPTPEMQAAGLRDGDLLISRSNTRERVGFVGRFVDEGRPTSFPDTMMRLRPNSARVTSEFLEMILQTPGVRGRVQAIAAGTSASMKKINKANLLQIRVAAPPLQVQRNLVAKWRALRDSESSVNSRSLQAATVYESLLAEALRT